MCNRSDLVYSLDANGQNYVLRWIKGQLDIDAMTVTLARWCLAGVPQDRCAKAVEQIVWMECYH
jgi:hypothetical protein